MAGWPSTRRPARCHRPPASPWAVANGVRRPGGDRALKRGLAGSVVEDDGGELVVEEAGGLEEAGTLETPPAEEVVVVTRLLAAPEAAQPLAKSKPTSATAGAALREVPTLAVERFFVTPKNSNVGGSRSMPVKKSAKVR